jgi:hypothetical protein
MNAGAAARAGRVAAVPACRHAAAAAGDRLVRGVGRGADWGRFDVRIDGRPRMLRVVAAMMNLRSRLTGIATGDQAIFVRRDALRARRRLPRPAADGRHRALAPLRAAARPACLRARVITSGRRWEARACGARSC